MAKAKTAKSTKKKATAKKASPKKKATKKKSATKKTTRKKPAGDTEVTVDRRAPKADRRQTELEEILNEELEAAPAQERRKVSRRRQIDPTTCERDYNNDEIEFMHALDAYKRSAGRMFPTCSEILEVVRDLGYYRLTPEQMAQLGIGGSTTEEGENAEGQASDQTDSNAATADSSDNQASLAEVSSANELSDSIRSDVAPPAEQASFAPVGFESNQLTSDDFASSADSDF